MGFALRKPLSRRLQLGNAQAPTISTSPRRASSNFALSPARAPLDGCGPAAARADGAKCCRNKIIRKSRVFHLYPIKGLSNWIERNNASQPASHLFIGGILLYASTTLVVELKPQKTTLGRSTL